MEDGTIFIEDVEYQKRSKLEENDGEVDFEYFEFEFSVRYIR